MTANGSRRRSTEEDSILAGDGMYLMVCAGEIGDSHDEHCAYCGAVVDGAGWCKHETCEGSFALTTERERQTS
jgi:hypothetical protein